MGHVTLPWETGLGNNHWSVQGGYGFACKQTVAFINTLTGSCWHVETGNMPTLIGFTGLGLCASTASQSSVASRAVGFRHDRTMHWVCRSPYALQRSCSRFSSVNRSIPQPAKPSLIRSVYHLSKNVLQIWLGLNTEEEGKACQRRHR